MNNVTVDRAAKVLWDYLQLHQTPRKSDAIFVLGSMDTRVAERAADLYKQGLGALIILSGGSGRLTQDVFNDSEANIFARIIESEGIPRSKLLLEDRSTNTGENIQFTHQLLNENNLTVTSLLLVQKPYMERRTYATFKKQWPDEITVISVTSPRISYKDYFNEACPKDLVLNVMVGDMQRIKEYPPRGFQIEQVIPDEVWTAYEQLVAAGYTKHLLSN